MAPEAYNPLDKIKIADNIVRELLTQPCSPLADVRSKQLVGAGIYALYYEGPFPAYIRESTANANGKCEQPIYVGKADPKGGRKGALDLDASVGKSLAERLAKHASSIDQAHNLDVGRFRLRSLVVDAVWISLGERRAIQIFKPVWNTLVDGFGNNPVGKGRAAGVRSTWDTLHPGRAWAATLPPRSHTAEQIIADILRPHAPAELERRAAENIDEQTE